MKSYQDMLLERLMKVYWLRPETVLWRAIDTNMMRGFEFKRPSLDIGCGDGVLSFIKCGGDFDYAFDVFHDVADLDKFFNKADVYNSFNKNLTNPVITKRPSCKMDTGIDIRDALLKKAETLDFFKELICYDCNKKLPFTDGFYETVFSNSLYWLDSPAHFLGEIYRILRPGGKAILMLPNSSFKEYTFYNNLYLKTGNEKWAWFDKIDRGRTKIRHAMDDKEWRRLFNKHGLKIVSHGPYLSKTAVKIWDIGLRPLFPVLCKMANSLSAKNRVEIKREWISLVSDLLRPILKMEQIADKRNPHAFHCYVVKK